ncbi:MAG: hypothetical protein NT062_05310 [Proteobacteria bacterium]|nr:hypothetical protein [Pseudomonadota bacterium]
MIMSARQDGALVARLLEGTLQAAEFTCQTRDETGVLAELLSRLFPEPPRARFALGELLLNAVEHGNLEIGSALKVRLIRELAFEDELAARHERAPYRARQVHVGVRIADDKLELEIRRAS